MHANSTWSSGSPPPNRRSCPRYRIIIIISREPHGMTHDSPHEHRIKACTRQQAPKQVRTRARRTWGNPGFSIADIESQAALPATRRVKTTHGIRNSHHKASGTNILFRASESSILFRGISACAEYLQQPRNYDPRRFDPARKPESASQAVASQESTIHSNNQRSHYLERA